ncbi:MAG: HAD family hydrolase [Deltaproteobacteria bacterium]|jgi:phosphoglycolate phosphatase|nr:HAD family hydrolase [Deltaproteobacteria bacterium]
MKYKAIIFDMDGTLLNTIDDLANSMNRVLSKDQFPTHTVADYKLMVGYGAYELVKRALPVTINEESDILPYLKQFKADYFENWNVKTELYWGVSEMLNSLEQLEIKLSILSNKPQPATLKCIEQYLHQYRFEIILGQREGIPVKPDPTGALEICDQLGLIPDQVIFIGDTAVDIETGKHAGMYTVGVTWGFRSRLELENAKADYIIDKPEMLMTIFN